MSEKTSRYFGACLNRSTFLSSDFLNATTFTTERNGRLAGWLASWLAGRSQSQEREARLRLRLRFVTSYRQRVFRACVAKSSVKKPRTYRKREKRPPYFEKRKQNRIIHSCTCVGFEEYLLIRILKNSLFLDLFRTLFQIFY